MYIIDFIIRTGIAYAFYAIPFSIATIKKLNKHIIRLCKKICGLPKTTPNLTTQLPRTLFGLEAFSFSNAYLQCINEQFRDVLNYLGTLGKIYQGLINYILAKNDRSQKAPYITNSACTQFPTTCTLYLFKTLANTHICSSKIPSHHNLNL